MAAIDRAGVERALGAIHDPFTDMDLVAAGAVDDIELTPADGAADGAADGEADVAVHIALGYPAEGIREAMSAKIQARVEALDGVRRCSVELGWKIEAQQPQRGMHHLAEVRNVIAVASGKGGVGKSTVAVNLALALSREGAKVGVLDADIYGPSQGIMLGIPDGRRPEVRDEQYFVPMTAHGIQAMSMSFLVDESTPMVWRGPMVSGALQQMLSQTLWSDLDYLIVDMPPGTGDIQLTLAQKVPVSGAVIVTTPQDIALLDARKGIEMFQKVDVPVLGVIENMSVHICSSCGRVEHLFGEGGGARVAERYGTLLLGSLPLSLQVREQADAGQPTLVAEPLGTTAGIFREIARSTAARLAAHGAERGARAPVITFDDD